MSSQTRRSGEQDQGLPGSSASDYFSPMKRRWGIRLVLAALAVWLAWKAWRLVEGDPILMLLFFIVSGAVASMVFVKVVLARMADAIGNAVFLSGGPQTPEDAETNNEDEEDAAAGGAKVEEAKTETP